MTAGSLQEVLGRDPFIPFRLKLSSGEAVEVANPSLVVVLRREVFIADPSRDHFHLYALSQVVGIESTEAA